MLRLAERGLRTHTAGLLAQPDRVRRLTAGPRGHTAARPGGAPGFAGGRHAPPAAAKPGSTPLLRPARRGVPILVGPAVPAGD